MRRHEKFCACRSVKPLRRYGRFSILQDGGRPPFWICFMHVLVVFVTVQLKFDWNRCSGFDNMQVLI